MNPFIRRIPLVAIVLMGLALPVRADVTDKGEFFSADAVKKANERIEESRKKHKKDLVIETYKEVPEDIRKEYLEEKKKEKGSIRPLFERWADKRAEKLDVNGVYIMLCKEASWLQIEVGNDTRKRAFPESARTRLRDDLGPLLKKEKYDEALDTAVKQVTKSYDDHAPVKGGKQQADGKQGGIGGWICLGVCVLLGVWVMFALIRAFSGGGGGGYGGGGGGGGFMTSFLGGMFGAAAGMWMYNSFFGGHSGMGGASAYGSDASSGDAGGYGNDTDYSGDGGSYGDDGGGGGGDFGGGGGDWGGGDI